MNKSVFNAWLLNSKVKDALRTQKTYISQVQTEFFVAKTRKGDPLCIFEVGKEVEIGEDGQNFLLRDLPPWSLKLPGYKILYQKKTGCKNRIITNFSVRKITPIERFIGDFSAHDFFRFLVATVAFYKSKNEQNKEKHVRHKKPEYRK
jgi:hypothetical protein